MILESVAHTYYAVHPVNGHQGHQDTAADPGPVQQHDTDTKPSDTDTLQSDDNIRRSDTESDLNELEKAERRGETDPDLIEALR